MHASNRGVESVSARAVRLVGAALGGYLIGTFPSADIAARRATGGRVDLRAVGSGNPGATNARDVLGRRFGYAVLATDIAKGGLAAAAGRALAGDAGAHTGGVAAVVGHCHPVWSRFRGGKGVAASVGQCLVTFPAYLPVDVAVALATASFRGLKRRALVTTAVSSACWTVAGVAWWRGGWPNLWGPRPSGALPLANAVSSAVILQRFRAAKRRGADDDLAHRPVAGVRWPAGLV